MIDPTQAQGWTDAVIRWASSLPQNAWAIILSVVISSLATQYLKVLIGPYCVQSPAITERTFRTIVRVFALFSGFCICYGIWPKHDFYRVWSSISVAFIAPILYKFTMMLLYLKWPNLEKKLSGYPGDPGEDEGPPDAK